MVEKSGVEKFLLALGLKSPGLESSWLKSSWLKSLGLKGLGLKLGVEKSKVEMSFNPIFRVLGPEYMTLSAGKIDLLIHFLCSMSTKWSVNNELFRNQQCLKNN